MGKWKYDIFSKSLIGLSIILTILWFIFLYLVSNSSNEDEQNRYSKLLDITFYISIIVTIINFLYTSLYLNKSLF